MFQNSEVVKGFLKVCVPYGIVPSRESMTEVQYQVYQNTRSADIWREKNQLNTSKINHCVFSF